MHDGLDATVLRQELTEALALNAELREENNQLQSNFDELQSAFSGVHSQIANLQQQLSAAVQDRMTLERGHEELCNKWKRELDEKTRQFEDLQAHVLPPRELETLRLKVLEELDLPHKELRDSLEEENNRLRMTVFEQKRDLQAAQEEKVFILAKHEKEMREADETHSATVADLQMHLDQVMEQMGDTLEHEVIEATQRENVTLNLRIKTITEELEAVRRQKEEATVAKEKASASAKERVVEMQHIVSKSQADQEALTRKTRHLEKELDESMRAHAKSTDYTARMEQEMAVLRSTVDDAERKCTAERTLASKQLREAEAQWRRKVEELEQQLEATRGECESQQAALQQAVSRAGEVGEAAAATRVEQLRRQVTAADEHAQEMASKVSTLEGEAEAREATLRAEVEDAERRAMAAETLRRTESSDKTSAQHELAALTRTVEDLEAQRDMAKRQTVEAEEEAKAQLERSRSLLEANHALQLEAAKLQLTVDFLEKDVQAAKEAREGDREPVRETAVDAGTMQALSKAQRRASKYKAKADTLTQLITKLKAHYKDKLAAVERRLREEQLRREELMFLAEADHVRSEATDLFQSRLQIGPDDGGGNSPPVARPDKRRTLSALPTVKDTKG